MPSPGGTSANPDAAFAEAYQTLRALADSYLRRYPEQGTLQATALVHEAYLKLVRAPGEFRDDAHFVRTAAMAMRQVLVDHARARATLKRSGGEPITLDGLDLNSQGSSNGLDVLVIDDALKRLAVLDARQAQIVELRCFIGLSVPEAAQNLNLSEATVKRDWAMARAWLERELEVR